MKPFKLLVCLLILPNILSAQEKGQGDTSSKRGITKTWIHLENNPAILRGVLYEVKDSSVVVSNSLLRADYLNGNFNLANINYNDINEIYLRKNNKVLAGTIIGSAAGLALAIAAAIDLGGKGDFAGAAVIIGLPAVTIGAGLGAFLTAFRIKIPVNGNFENFKINESRLQRHSYLNEYSNGPNRYEKNYEHKWFLGLTMNMSIPSGEFEERLPVNINGDLSKTGGSLNMILGYRIKDNLGLAASIQNSSYNFKNTTSDFWWSITSATAGPMFSFPIRDQMYFDLKPMIGYASSSLINGQSEMDSGEGIGIYPTASLTYNFSLRWAAIAETGFLYSNQKFEDGYRKLHSYNLGVGIAYRFR